MAELKKKLNGLRRSPRSLFVILFAALMVVGSGYTAVNAAVSPNQQVVRSEDQVNYGKKLFLSNCASCHGKNAEGRDKIAPSLIGVGEASVDFQVSTGRMPGAASGPQLQVKPVQFTEEQISALAAYVGSLAPGPAIPDAAYLQGNGDSSRGGELFRVNCAMCHNAAGAGGALTEGKYAPNLMKSSAKTIYEAMITGPQNMPVFNDANISPEEKNDIITYLQYLQTNKSVGGDELGNLGPVVEGLLTWLGLLGIIVAITIWLGAKSN
ncbi:MAG: cystathionine beta-lyase [Micrococcales bacterium]|nr:cystathionine beta-lyase [Micrococcales bacterium]NBR54427.1 cystathionine beta-lyase [Micrococcales bacterium]NBR60399.1 cystathionine beta-lyase [Actinomycetota bacterium]NBT46262.1 cystathionine beta-lyase [Actinomycetota bacterium]NBY44352.1 cystathionine beta-lyase [Micrococcales bacterium]